MTYESIKEEDFEGSDIEKEDLLLDLRICDTFSLISFKKIMRDQILKN
jgi:hypothetical protein